MAKNIYISLYHLIRLVAELVPGLALSRATLVTTSLCLYLFVPSCNFFAQINQVSKIMKKVSLPRFLHGIT